MSVLIPIGLLAIAALVTFAVRRRLTIAALLSLTVTTIAWSLVAGTPPDGAGVSVLDTTLRSSELSRLAGTVILVILGLLIVDVWIGEPAYNFFPTALAVAACALAVLTLETPLAIYAVLILALLLPVGAFTFHVHRNRSVEAAVRHFGFVMLGGALGCAALALEASLPKGQPATTFVLLAVVLVVAFALMLAAIPFHTHAALLVSEAPVSALALYFGVLVPVTFLAFVRILTLSGLLPAIAQVQKVQDVLMAIGLISALGGALLASGAHDLRRLVVYAVISNLGVGLVGIATFSGSGIVGAIATVLVTGACATQQLLAAGAIERAGRGARGAPLAAAAFVAGGVGMIGLPPLVGFPGHFFVELIAFAFNGTIGAALVLATLLLLVGQLRAALTLFGERSEPFRVEARPVAGLVGLVIFLGLLLGGLSPDVLLDPIAAFADDFIRALSPL